MQRLGTETMEKISLAEGSGGVEMTKLIESFGIIDRGKWTNTDDDSSILKLPDGQYLVFTTDSFTVDPLFFPGGDIGHLAACGTINDISVMGAVPLGISFSLIIEEGFDKEQLMRIVESFKSICRSCNVSIATGDTKVMPKGKVDKIIINTSAVSITDSILNQEPTEGDKIILSGSIGDHAVALLSKRFSYETDIITDSKPILKEIQEIKNSIKIAKDPTRGGLAAILNEISSRYNIGMHINEKQVPLKQEVKTVTEMLGLDPFQLACEGRFMCIAPPKASAAIVEALKRYNKDAAIIGEIKGKEVILQTKYGSRMIPQPTGRIVPRIC